MKHLPIIWLALAATGAASAAPVLAFIPRPVTSADFAAWAQGLGTILAVSLGAWLSLAPDRRQARELAQAKVEFILDLGDALDIGAAAVRRIETALAGGQVNATRVAIKALEASDFQSELAQLLEAPRGYWPDQPTRSQARLLHRLLQRLRADQLPLDMDSATVQSVWIRQVDEQIQFIAGMIVNLSRAIGRPIDDLQSKAVVRRQDIAKP